MSKPFNATDGTSFVRELNRRVARLERVGWNSAAAVRMQQAVQASAIMTSVDPEAQNVIVATSEPDPTVTDLAPGDVWKDTSLPEPLPYVWDGTSWIRSEDPSLNYAMGLQNSTIEIYHSEEEPEGDRFPAGSLWENTLTGRVSRWNGQDWISTAVTSGGELERTQDRLDETLVGSVLEYAVNTSETVPPTTGWSTETPTRDEGEFIWFRAVLTYGDGSVSVSNPALLTGNTGVPGPPGEDGNPTYTWIKYADDENGGGMSDTPTGKEYLGLAANKPTPLESTDPDDYQWSKIRGEDGSDGVPGPPGEDGATLYTWIKFADTPTTGMSDDPEGKAYFGIAYNKATPTESTNYGDYQWSLTKGEPGEDGAQGIPGPPGADGQPTYTWVRYADDDQGAGFSNDPTGKDYIGFAFNKTTPTESTNPGDYTWSKYVGPEGEDGLPGPPGDDGQPTFIWVKYAFDDQGTGLSDDPTGRSYIGLAYNKNTEVESTDPGDYTWSLFQGPPGADGADGVPGPPGEDGESLFTWIKFADTPTTGMSDDPTGKDYLGLAYNKPTATESTDYNDYQWTLTRGNEGEQGIPGAPGDDGVTLYTWVKYADTDAGAGMSDDPTGKDYIGLAYNKTTPVESTTPGDYTWALFKGDPGIPGVSIVSVTPFFYRSASEPTQPVTDPPPAGWQTTEWEWVEDTSLWRTERVQFSNSTFAYTDVTKVAAYEEIAPIYEAIDVVQVSADGKNKNTFSDVAAPGPGSPPADDPTRTVGDIHWNRDSTTKVIYARWDWDGVDWIPVAIGSSAIDSLDVGKLSAGAAEIDTAVINKLWTDVVQSRQITTDMLKIGDPTNWLDNPLTNVGEGGWNGANPIAVSPHPRNGDGMLRLTANGTQQWLTNKWLPCSPDDQWKLEALIRRTTTGAGSGVISLCVVGQDAAGNNIGPYVAASIERTSMTNGVWNLVQGFVGTPPGAVRLRFEVWLDPAWTSGNIDLTAFDFKRANADLILGDEGGVHIKGQSNHITVYAPGDIYPDLSRGPAKPMQVFGGATGGAFMAFDPSSGDELGGIQADGSMFSPSAEFGSIRVGGKDISELVSGVGKGLGTDYLDSTHYGWSSEVGLIGFEIKNLIAGHVYRISISMRGALSVSTSRTIMAIRATTNGTAPSVSSSLLGAIGDVWPVDWSFANDQSGFSAQRYHEFTFVPTSNITRLRCLFTGRVVGTGVCDSRSYVVNVRYEGPQQSIGLYNAYSAPPALPFDETFNFADHATYSQYGATSSTHKGYYVRHGTGGSSHYRTYLTEPAGARTLINGGGVTDIRVGLTFAQDYPYSTPYLGTWTSVGGTISNVAQVSGGPTSHGQYEEVSLTSAQRSAVSAGAKIAVGRTTSATLVSYYGSASGTPSYRPRIRVIGSQ